MRDTSFKVGCFHHLHSLFFILVDLIWLRFLVSILSLNRRWECTWCLSLLIDWFLLKLSIAITHALGNIWTWLKSLKFLIWSRQLRVYLRIHWDQAYACTTIRNIGSKVLSLLDMCIATSIWRMSIRQRTCRNRCHLLRILILRLCLKICSLILDEASSLVGNLI